MDQSRLLGTTSETSVRISPDDLGSPGFRGQIIVKAMFEDRDNDDPIRTNDETVRSFEIKAKLSKDVPSSFDMNGAFEREAGASFFIASRAVDHIEVVFPNGTIRLDTNERHELSMASAVLEANSARSAHDHFVDLLTRYLDRMSFVSRAPAHIAITVVRDVAHEVQYFSYIAPPSSQRIIEGGESLSLEMKPVYALYREAMNSSSPYYRVLCFNKIMEGLFGPRPNDTSQARATSRD